MGSGGETRRHQERVGWHTGFRDAYGAIAALGFPWTLDLKCSAHSLGHLFLSLGPMQRDLPSPGLGEQVETQSLEPPPAVTGTTAALTTFGMNEDNNCLSNQSKTNRPRTDIKLQIHAFFTCNSNSPY